MQGHPTSGQRRSATKLTPRLCRTVRFLRLDYGLRYKEILQRFPIARSTAWRIVNSAE